MRLVVKKRARGEASRGRKHIPPLACTTSASRGLLDGGKHLGSIEQQFTYTTAYEAELVAKSLAAFDWHFTQLVIVRSERSEVVACYSVDDRDFHGKPWADFPVYQFVDDESSAVGESKHFCNCHTIHIDGSAILCQAFIMGLPRALKLAASTRIFIDPDGSPVRIY